MSLATVMAKARRLKILQALMRAPAHRLTASVIHTLIRPLGLNGTRAFIESDIALLEQHELVVMEQVASDMGDVCTVILTEAGREVAEGMRPSSIVDDPALS